MSNMFEVGPKKSQYEFKDVNLRGNGLTKEW